MSAGRLPRHTAAALILTAGSVLAAAATPERLEIGRRMYQDGLLPSGESITATVRGDITLGGEHVICGTCHRRSGMGFSEGQQVIPSTAGLSEA